MSNVLNMVFVWDEGRQVEKAYDKCERCVK